MTPNADEKEVVLGNKQLVSFFFVVLALCGVFFALGYMIGRNSTKNTVIGSETAPSASPVPRNQESEPPRETMETARPADTVVTPPVVAETPTPAPAAAPTQTQPAREIAATPEPKPAPAPVAAAPSGITIPEPGASYLQVTALRRGDADSLVKTLREEALPAVIAESSKPDLFRVLVGPYRQTAQVAEAKARLKALGFANAFVQR